MAVGSTGGFTGGFTGLMVLTSVTLVPRYEAVQTCLLVDEDEVADDVSVFVLPGTFVLTVALGRRLHHLPPPVQSYLPVSITLERYLPVRTVRALSIRLAEEGLVALVAVLTLVIPVLVAVIAVILAILAHVLDLLVRLGLLLSRVDALGVLPADTRTALARLGCALAACRLEGRAVVLSLSIWAQGRTTSDAREAAVRERARGDPGRLDQLAVCWLARVWVGVRVRGRAGEREGAQSAEQDCVEKHNVEDWGL